MWVVADSSKHVASGQIIDAGSICTNNCDPDMTDMTEGLTVDSEEPDTKLLAIVPPSLQRRGAVPGLTLARASSQVSTIESTMRRLD